MDNLLFAILFGRTILFNSHLRAERNHHPLVGMDNDCFEHLPAVWNAVILLLPFQAVWRTDLFYRQLFLIFQQFFVM